MKKFELTIIASGLHPDEPHFEDRFFEAGCDDATIAFVKGRIVLEFEREARNFSHALITAIRDVQNAGATVEHIEPDYLVSLSDIAERSNLTRSAISLFAQGKRGEAFPPPIARLTTESPLWDWVHVARWMYRRRQLSLDALVQAKLVREANRAMAESARIDQSRYGQKILAQIAA
jgi:transcriptional regulator with XRE-family HTH domain